MKKSTLTSGNRVGRDRRPYARWVYALWTTWWAVITGLYVVELATDTVTGPAWLAWFFLAVGVLYLVGSARIWLQYPERTREWADTVRERNAATRARYAPLKKEN